MNTLTPFSSGPVELVLVEDNALDAEMAMRVLSKLQPAPAIGWLRDGAEAIEYFFGTAPAMEARSFVAIKVVLLDLKLPRVDGHEVLRRLKSDARTRRLPVVVLSSSREETDIARCYATGANSYLVKPVEFEKYSELVRGLGQYWLSLNQVPPPAA